jgi:hypothetical protein
MSKLYDLRAALKAHLVANAGWDPEAIIIKRQTDIWNDVAIAIETAKNNLCMVIGVAQGRNPDPDGKLIMDLTVPVTILATITLEEGATPEEDVWEQMVLAVHGTSLHPTGHCRFEFQFESFADDIELGDGRPQWIARQTVFKVRQNF